MPSPEADTRREEEGHLERFYRDGAPIFYGVFRHLERSSWRGGGNVRSDTVSTCLQSIAFPPSLYSLPLWGWWAPLAWFSQQTQLLLSPWAQSCQSDSRLSCRCLQESPPHLPALPLTLSWAEAGWPAPALKFPVPSCCWRCCCLWVAPLGTFLAWMAL